MIIDRNNPYRSTTTIDPKFISEDRGFRFFLQLHFGAAVTESMTVDDNDELFVTAHDGSWFVVNGKDGAEFGISQGGPRRMWDTVEVAHMLWQRLGQPDRGRFGVTATGDEVDQFVWLERAVGSNAWPLPL